MGPQGLTGPKGDKGDTGAAGSHGAAGAPGSQGPAGADGAQGPAGAAGSQGPGGAVGATGATGATGPQGPKGDKGDKGDTGAQGPKGDKGDTGATGPQGPAGASGMVTAKEVYLDAAVNVPTDTTTAVTAISLPAGSYRLDAVTRLTKAPGGADWACSLNGDPATSSTTDDVDSGTFGHTQNTSVTANMHLTATLSSAGTIVLRCRSTAAVTARETKIIASPVGAANRVAGSAGASGS
jgi:hypothetical protein